MAHADKTFHDNEKDFLVNILKEKNFSEDQYNKILDEVITSDKSYKEQCLELVNQIKNQDQRERTLKLLAELTAADFVLHEDEMLLLQIIADEWGMYKERLTA